MLTLEQVSEYNHKALLEMQEKGYGYVFMKDIKGNIVGCSDNYENSDDLEKLAVDTPNGKIYPFRISI